MTPADYEVRGEVWRYDGGSAWHFITLPADVADEIRARNAGLHRAFGSLPVYATIGSSRWRTSLFADTKLGSYVLPLQADVRRRERLDAGDTTTVRISLVP